ncbi:hypothetical protein ACFY3M_43140 [Streptomyces mirabilis]|uniref:hypothetical protein n=1 Tax=Streptomyces mirabilis TaxID=68239 RepID=UPI0036A53880
MTKTKEPARGAVFLVYRCRLPLSTRTLTHVAHLLRRHLKAVRSRWRALPPGKIALIVLAVLRHDQRLADMAGGNNISATTVRRWRDEIIGLLAAKASRPDRALKKIAKRGSEVVLIDGTLIPTQRRTGAANGRAPVEHGFAHLKSWRILTKLRADPARATHLMRALLVLTNLEVLR